MDKENLIKAFWIWTQFYSHQEINEATQVFLEIPETNLDLKTAGWIQRVRGAQFLTMETASERIGVSREAWRQFEKNESEEKITLESLRKAAEALDCELVYGFRPKNKKLFSMSIWQQLSETALDIYQKRTRSTKIKPLVLANIAKNLMLNSDFRKEKGWSRNQPRP